MKQAMNGHTIYRRPALQLQNLQLSKYSREREESRSIYKKKKLFFRCIFASFSTIMSNYGRYNMAEPLFSETVALGVYKLGYFYFRNSLFEVCIL